MKLKYKLESLDGLSDELKALYEEKDGVFILTGIDGMPQGEDVTGLKAKVQELLDEKKAESEKARTAAEEARQAKEEKAKKEGDFQALSESYEQKIKDLETQLQERDQAFAQKEIQRQSMLIAAELSEGANQEILSTFIEKRLRLEGDEIKVTDEKGNLTISTVDQLKQEFRSNPKFGALVVASHASGGGAGGARPASGGAVGKKFTEMTEQERTELYRNDKEKYRRLRDAESN